ncbi:MAG: two-component system, sensor histidine kinase PdtaS [Chloroflexota bacterium]|nr:two-component system, sensor histidine kinase PdtaS [Chloroflexota bacterium]
MIGPMETLPSERRSDDRRLQELAFLHEIARLATLARDWDELMRTIVDRTTEAMDVQVCSFYLADRERTRLTLEATNGLDRGQVGKITLPFGSGITGRVAATREPIAVDDVTRDPRFSWVRGLDLEGLTGMLSVPLIWHDDVVGVLNVQAAAPRRFQSGDVEYLRTIGALLVGIIEKGRLQAEVEARLEQLTALDAARAELLSVVTHELRTPLSVVRVYVDLLGDAARGVVPPQGPNEVDAWQAAALDQVSRLDRLVDSILASVRGEGLTGLSRAPFDAVVAVDETVETLRLLLRPRPIRWERPADRLIAVGDEARFRQVLEQLLENESKYAPQAEGVSIGIWRLGNEVQAYVTDDGPGVPIEDWESVFEPFVRIEGRGRSRGSGIGLFAARRLMDAMGGRIVLEPNGFGGSRFVVALPAGR